MRRSARIHMIFRIILQPKLTKPKLRSSCCLPL